MKKSIAFLAVAAPLLALTAGCTTLNGSIKGQFSCLPAQGNCKPTSVIDAEARARMVAALKDLNKQAQARHSDTATIKVMLAAYTDAQGRFHEAKAIHVPVTRRAVERFVARPKTRAILQTLNERIQQIKSQKPSHSNTESDPADSPQLPDGQSPDTTQSGPEGSGLHPSHQDQTPPNSSQSGQEDPK